MKKKKQIEDWQIAAIHWLIAGIAMPFLFSAVFGYEVKKIAESFGVIVWMAILGEAIKFALIWLGIVYSAKYITRTFVIKNSEMIVKIATIYLFIFVGGFRLIFFDSSSVMNYVFSSMHLISLLVVVPFFYFVSKNYIKNNENIDSGKN
jgi:hypothetical protein